MIKIAVCMYGCYRTGDYTLDYIRKFFDLAHENAEVDFFCSVKEYDQFLNLGDEHVLAEPVILTEERKDRIKNKLTDVLQPKRINFINDLGKQRTQVLLSSIIDSVFLKKQYEAEHNIKYDIVFLYRYDLIVNHVAYLEAVMHNWQKDETVNYMLTHNNVLKPRDILFCDVLSSVWKPGHQMSRDVGAEHVWSGITVYEDLLVFGTGSAVDKIIYEYMRLSRDNLSALHVVGDLEGHYMLSHAIRHANVTRLDLPRIRNDGNGIYIEEFSLREHDQHHYHRGIPFLLRPTYKWQEDDNIFSERTLARISAHFAEN